MHRRDLLKALAGSLGAAACTPATLRATSLPAKTSLGLVIYCCNLRQQLQKRQHANADLFEPLRFLEYCRGLGAGGIQVPLGVRDAQYARSLRTQAEQCGMFVEGIVSPPRDRAGLERFEAEIRTAASAGAEVVRTVVIPGRRYEQFDSAAKFQEAVQQARKSLQLAEPILAKHRIRLAVENHKDQRVAERLELLKQIGSEWIGACVDTGNDLALLEDPVASVRAYAPWAFSVHLKDHAVAECADGFLVADVPLGQGLLDLQTMVGLLRKAKPNLHFILELITRDPIQVPCLAEKYWATLGDVPGRQLARTLRTIRAHARQDLPRLSHLPLEKQIEIETSNVTRSLAYAREHLGL